MRRLLAACCASALLATSCAVRPRDPFIAAAYALQHDDLLGALSAYDSVPVSHARYPDARAAAASVERRMRRCHELILEALTLRGEWRDEEALAALLRAHEQWPQEPSIARWIETTRQRLQLFAQRPSDNQVAQPPAVPPAVPHVEVQRPVSVAEQTGASVPAAKAVTQSDTEPVPPQRPAVVVPVEPAVVAAPDDSPAADEVVAGSGDSIEVSSADGVAPRVGESHARPGSPPSTNAGEDPVALGLVAVEARLGRGQLEAAVRDLIELARRFPDELRVQRRLAPLLHQRALLRYGQGAVAAAVADWRRVMHLDPDNAEVQSLLDRAVAESER